MPTLLDVARLAGVGKATASRALSGLRGVSADKRNRVLRTAEQLGYQPDPIAQRQSARRWRSSSVHQTSLAYLRNQSIEGYLMKDAVASAAKHGYTVEFAQIHRKTMIAQLRELHARGVAGLLIRADQGRFPSMPAEWRHRFRMVVMGGHPHYHCPHVAFDFSEAVRLCYHKAKQAGRRRIGFWMIDEPRHPAHQRGIGGVLSLIRNRRQTDPEPLLFTTPAADQHREKVQAWLERERPDALVAPTEAHLGTLADTGGGALGGRWLAALMVNSAAASCAHVDFRFSHLQTLGIELLARELRVDQPSQRETLTLLAPEWQPGLASGL